MASSALHRCGRHVDRLLRPSPDLVTLAALPWKSLVLLLVVAGFAYGAVMGFYAGSFLQAAYSGTKVPLLLGITTLLCLPSFFVLNTALGLRADFAEALRGILAAQAALALALVSLAPLTALLYQSGISYRTALLANGLMFFLATIAGQMSLRRTYALLRARDPRHERARRAWLAMYGLVAIQLAWMLRPFIGTPELPSQFFRDEPFDNAYVIVARTLWTWLQGGS